MVFINCFTEMWKENREVPGAFTLFLYSYKIQIQKALYNVATWKRVRSKNIK